MKHKLPPNPRRHKFNFGRSLLFSVFFTGTITVNAQDCPTLTVTPGSEICDGESITLMASGASSYSWAAEGLTATAGAKLTVRPKVTTTYTVTGTKSGCARSKVVKITVRPRPVLSVQGKMEICEGEPTTLTAYGASAFAWSVPDGSDTTINMAKVTFRPKYTTTYYLTGTNAAGCATSMPVKVIVKPRPVLSVEGPREICEGESTTLIAMGAGSYSWTNGNDTSRIDRPKVVLKPMFTTTYYVTGTSANGCSSTMAVKVIVRPKPKLYVQGDLEICEGESTTLTAYGATTYSWMRANDTAKMEKSKIVVKPSVTTTYYLTGTNSSGCMSQIAVKVIVRPRPVITVEGNMEICEGESTTLTAFGASTYSWMTANDTNRMDKPKVVVRPTTTTTYYVTGTNALGCSGQMAVKVIVRPKPVLTVEGDMEICEGESTTLTAFGASTYSWMIPNTNPNDTTGTAITINKPKIMVKPNGTTTYYLRGVSSFGCVSTMAVKVIVRPKPVLSIDGLRPYCQGEKVTLTAMGASTYVWMVTGDSVNKIGAKQTFSAEGSTTFYLQGTSASGCTSTIPAQLVVNPKPVITIQGDLEICEGESTSVYAFGSSSFTWTKLDGGINDSVHQTMTGSKVTLNPMMTTSYMVSGMGSNGCMGQLIFKVVVKQKPMLSVMGNRSYCEGESSVLTASGASRYFWFRPNDTTTFDGPKVTVSFEQSTTIYVRGTSSSGCVNNTAVQITVNQRPKLYISGPLTICEGQSTMLVAHGATVFNWQSEMGNVGNDTIVVNPKATTTFTLTGFNNSPTGGALSGPCASIMIVKVVVKPRPMLGVIGDRIICQGQSTTLTATGASSYSWSKQNDTAKMNQAKITVNPMNNTTYLVKGSKDNGCEAMMEVMITVKPKPYIQTSVQNMTICMGTAAKLKAYGAASYYWMPLDSAKGDYAMADSAVVHPMQTTTYTVVGSGSINSPGGGTAINDGPFCMSEPKYITVNVVYCPGGPKSLETSVSSESSVVASRDGEVFPNPTNGTVNIFPISGGSSTISISDAIGNVIYQTTATSSVVVDLSGNANGLYFVKIVSGSSVITKKIIKE